VKEGIRRKERKENVKEGIRRKECEGKECEGRT
jgi:hypothetical protein